MSIVSRIFLIHLLFIYIKTTSNEKTTTISDALCRDVLWHGSERVGSGAAIRIRPGRTLHEGEAEHDAFLHICRSALVPEGQ